MPNPFSRTTRSLDADPAGWWTALAGVALCVLAAWTVWLVAGRVTLYDVAADARLEVDSAARPITAPVAGRVVRTRLSTGRAVRAGEVLVELDAEPERLRHVGNERAIADLATRAAAARQELRAAEAALREHAAARGAAAAAARAAAEAAEARAALAEDEARRLAVLNRAGGATELELTRARADAAARRAGAEEARLAAVTQGRDRTVEEGDRRANVAALRRQLAELEGEMAVRASESQGLAYSAEQRIVRAAAAGTVSEATSVEPGAVVQAGERLGTIVPAGVVRAVAFFPAAAAGRVRPGQPARIRLAGFAWTEYGAVPARVVNVAAEPEQGRFRVELSLDTASTSHAPIEHGLPGTVSVAVERVRPVELVLRAAGRLAEPARAAR